MDRYLPVRARMPHRCEGYILCIHTYIHTFVESSFIRNTLKILMEIIALDGIELIKTIHSCNYESMQSPWPFHSVLSSKVITQISAGKSWSAALTVNGDVYTWGNRSFCIDAYSSIFNLYVCMYVCMGIRTIVHDAFGYIISWISEDEKECM